jgi:hypothetical protein
MDNSISIVRSILEYFSKQVNNAKASGTIEQYQSDPESVHGLFLQLWSSVSNTKGQHCKNGGCNASKLQTKKPKIV